MAKKLELTTQTLLAKMESQHDKLAIENEARRKNWIPKFLRDKPSDWYSPYT